MPRLRVIATCPGTGWVPGQVVDATPDEAQQFLSEGRAELVRGRALEQARNWPGDREEGRRGVRPR